MGAIFAIAFVANMCELDGARITSIGLGLAGSLTLSYILAVQSER